MSIYRINFLPKLNWKIKMINFLFSLKRYIVSNIVPLSIMFGASLFVISTISLSYYFLQQELVFNQKIYDNWQNSQCYLSYDHEYLLHGKSKISSHEKILGGYSSVEKAEMAAKEYKCESLKKMIGGYQNLDKE